MAVLSLRRNRTQHGCPLVGFLHPGVRLSSPSLTSLRNASVNFPLVPDTVPEPSPPCRPFHTVVAAPQRKSTHTLTHQLVLPNLAASCMSKPSLFQSEPRPPTTRQRASEFPPSAPAQRSPFGFPLSPLSLPPSLSSLLPSFHSLTLWCPIYLIIVSSGFSLYMLKGNCTEGQKLMY